VLSGDLGVDVVLETAGHLTRSVGHCETQRKPGRFYVAAEHPILHKEGILRNTGIFSHICGREAAEFLCTYNKTCWGEGSGFEPSVQRLAPSELVPVPLSKFPVS
jgi:hypothetical protein